MESSFNYYDVLNVSRNATMEEIKAAYRKMAKRWHPDAHVGESDEDRAYADKMFKLVNEAYHALNNGWTEGSQSQNYSYQSYYTDTESYSGAYGNRFLLTVQAIVDNLLDFFYALWDNRWLVIGGILSILGIVAGSAAVAGLVMLAIFLWKVIIVLITTVLPIALIVGAVGYGLYLFL